jgi:hypothetical protein
MRKRGPSLLALLTALLSTPPSLAIDVPQTREEFVQAIAGGRGAGPETIRVQQPLDKVYAVLEERLTACLDKKVERTAYVGYVERSSTDYNPTLRHVGADGAEFTLQVEHHPRGVGHTPPPGGLFMMAADLRSSEGGTEIVLYRPKIGPGKITASLKQWLAGEPAPCPKLR